VIEQRQLRLARCAAKPIALPMKDATSAYSFPAHAPVITNISKAVQAMKKAKHLERKQI